MANEFDQKWVSNMAKKEDGVTETVRFSRKMSSDGVCKVLEIMLRFYPSHAAEIVSIQQC